MGKYFGTDGIRGVANKELDATLAYKVGAAAAYVLTREGNHKPKFLIGKDTRISSDMIEASLVAGICSTGADVELLGVIPTPAVAFLTTTHKADAGIVISASHNTFEYNGIKIFSSTGYKLSDEIEAEVEKYIDNPQEIPLQVGEKIGIVIDTDEDPCEEYISHIASSIDGTLKGLRVVIDCANGSASTTARDLFKRLKLNAEVIFTSPNGININNKCGSTHLSNLKNTVVAGQFDVGIALDGDADRCLVIDNEGQEIDGDCLMAIMATRLKAKGKLKGNAFVATVMSNMGLHKFARENGLGMICSDVGDRYVLEKMLEKGYNLGGEQSGHIIFRDYASTGDGQLTAIQFLKILKDSGKTASSMRAEVVPFPQTMINVPVPNEIKKNLLDNEEIANFIKTNEGKLGEGRVLVRPSGTEALVRVMVEGIEEDKVLTVAKDIADFIVATLESNNTAN
ncbi:MAG: phosphoglucosamine mutase [Clostridia bacterium]